MLPATFKTTVWPKGGRIHKSAKASFFVLFSCGNPFSLERRKAVNEPLGVRATLDKLAETSWMNLRTGQEELGHARARLKAARGAIASAYNLENEIRELSHRGIVAFKTGDFVGAEQCKMAMVQPWEKLSKLDLPGDIFWQHDAQAGQELVEFHGVLWLYSKIFGGPSLEMDLEMRSAEYLKTTIPTWLAGIADAVTETSKLLRNKLRDHQISRDERIALREKFIATAEEVLEFLGQFEDCPPALINNSRRRGYMNTFRGALSRVETCIERHEEALVSMLDQSSK